MTASLCLRCATLKNGPWAPCPECAFQPNEPDDMAKAMILSEEKYTHAELQEMRGRHQRGEPWQFDPALVARCRKWVDGTGVISPSGNQSEKTFKEQWPVLPENPGDYLIDNVLLPIAVIGVPIVPPASIGRAVVKLFTWGYGSCREETAWMIGLSAQLLFVAYIVFLIVR